MTSTIAENLSRQPSDASKAQYIVDLKNKILEVKGAILNPQKSEYRSRLLGKISELSMFDRDDATKERSSIRAMLAKYRERLLTEQSADMSERLCNEAALVNEIRIAFREGEVSQVRDLIKKYIPYVKTKDNKRALLMTEVFVHERLGEYADAWSALQAAKAIEPNDDRKKAYAAPSYCNVETMLQEKAKAAGITLNEVQSSEDTQQLPRTIALLQNYPNPFNPTTTIKYEIPNAGQVTLKVYDMLGRVVAVLQDGMKDAGSWTATFDASKLSSGVYFSRLTVQPQEDESVVLVKKMLLVK